MSSGSAFGIMRGCVALAGVRLTFHPYMAWFYKVSHAGCKGLVIDMIGI